MVRIVGRPSSRVMRARARGLSRARRSVERMTVSHRSVGLQGGMIGMP